TVEKLRNNDWAARRDAELIETKLALLDSVGILKEVRGVKLVVAQELPRRTVESVGTRLDRRIQNRRAGTTEFRAETARLHFELFDGINRRKNDEVGAIEEVDGIGIVIQAVEKIVVLRRTQTVRGERAVRFVTATVFLRTVDACRDLRQKRKIAAIQRQIVYGSRVNDLADGGVLRLKDRRARRNFNCLAHRARIQCNVGDHALADVHDDSVLHRRL